MVAPVTIETEMQTDRWKPQGLILRQRNDLHRIPQRYLGGASVTIACGQELLQDELPIPAALSPLVRAGSSLNQSPRSSVATSERHSPSDTDESMRDLLEFGTKQSGRCVRNVKTSKGTTRPRNLSRLFLSSDGIAQKYVAPSNHGANRRDEITRPSTTT